MLIALSSLIVFSLSFTTSDQNLRFCYIAFGQAHFLLTYLYQYRNGKYSSRVLIGYSAALISAHIFANFDYQTFLLLVSIFFLLHNFYDEMRIMKVENSLLTTLCILPSGIMLVLYSLYGSTSFAKTALQPLFTLSLTPLLITFLKKDYSLYALHNSFRSALIGATLFFDLASPIQLWAYVIVFHYILWYIKLARQFYAEDRSKFTRYAKEVVVLNIAMPTLLILSLKVSALSSLYQNFFSPKSFYIWTLMHLLVTFRFSDYTKIFIKLTRTSEKAALDL